MHLKEIGEICSPGPAGKQELGQGRKEMGDLLLAVETTGTDKYQSL